MYYIIISIIISRLAVVYYNIRYINNKVASISVANSIDNNNDNIVLMTGAVLTKFE